MRPRALRSSGTALRARARCATVPVPHLPQSGQKTSAPVDIALGARDSAVRGKKIKKKSRAMTHQPQQCDGRRAMARA